MKNNPKNQIVFIEENISIASLIEILNHNSDNTLYPGNAIVTDAKNRLLGVITDGDIRRGFSNGVSLSDNISVLLNTTPITIKEEEIREKDIIKNKIKDLKYKIKFIPVIDNNKIVVRILSTLNKTKVWSSTNDFVSIYGLGYVGLTLGVYMASLGWRVRGIDSNLKVLENLERGDLQVYEPNLKDTLQDLLCQKMISLHNSCEGLSSSMHVIAVGTPVDEEGNPDLNALTSVTRAISNVIKQGDLVTLRSTVPLGTSRDLVAKILENGSGLIAGLDFHLAFTPERTIEGAALKELENLPQIIGGLTDECALTASDFFSKISPSTVITEKIEGAELVKLLNNSFRDLSFAFANEVSQLADNFNLNAFALIDSANLGYPRNKIPYPSPGVGGYCLTKDPLIYHKTIQKYSKNSNKNSLASLGRLININSINLVYDNIEYFAKNINEKIDDLKIFIVGIAFKGNPETADYRGSTSLDLFEIIKSKNKDVYGIDNVISDEKILKLGFKLPKNLDYELNDYSAVYVIMNNHSKNGIVTRASAKKFNFKNILIYDCWNIVSEAEFKSFNNAKYATLGYKSFKE